MDFISEFLQLVFTVVSYGELFNCSFQRSPSVVPTSSSVERDTAFDRAGTVMESSTAQITPMRRDVVSYLSLI